jgi:hypothetical protein
MNSQVEKVLQMALIDKRDFNRSNVTEVNLHDVIQRAVENIWLYRWSSADGTATGSSWNAETPIVEGRYDAHFQHDQQPTGQCQQVFTGHEPVITVFTTEM